MTSGRTPAPESPDRTAGSAASAAGASTAGASAVGAGTVGSADSGLAALGQELVRQLRTRSVFFHEAAAERLGLNATDLKCLDIVSAEGSVTPGRLAELSGLTTGAVTGVIDRLERAGFVRREADPRDRRSVTVSLVPARSAETAAIFASLEQATAELLGRFDEKERAAIREYVTRAGELLAQETARLRVSARGGMIGDTFTAPLGGATVGRLVFASGAPRFAWRAAPLGPAATARVVVETSASRLFLGGAAPVGELIRATFKGPPPDIAVRDGVVTMRYKRLAVDWRARGARIALTDTIPWTIEVEGGLSDLDADLREVRFAGLQVRGGVDHVTMRLPDPIGSVPLHIVGGANGATFLRPSGAAVRLSAAGGVSGLTLDDQRLGAIGGQTRLQTPNYGMAEDRYEIDIAGGANHVTVAS